MHYVVASPDNTLTNINLCPYLGALAFFEFCSVFYKLLVAEQFEIILRFTQFISEKATHH